MKIPDLEVFHQHQLAISALLLLTTDPPKNTFNNLIQPVAINIQKCTMRKEGQ
jgi:hypothetical protein